MRLTLRALDRFNSKDIVLLQKVLEEAPRYALNVSGTLPASDAARSTLDALPDGKSLADKFVFGIFADDEMIGCVDLIRGYPNEKTAMLGLLLLNEANQRKGFGRDVYAKIEKLVSTWPEISKIRIGVVVTNSEALPFWKSCGFQESGPRRPYQNGTVVSENIILEKKLS